MGKPEELDEMSDYVKAHVEVSADYSRCQRCIEGECNTCENLKANKLDETLANWMRPRMPFPNL